tara:strand:+ start:1060 stop:1980 length:921 start_codon:yes stop_codon:yes gene_type:complete
MKILCLTPVKHLDGVYDYLKSFGLVDYYPNLNKESVKGLIDSFDYDVIFCNPNKQSYLLDNYVLTKFNGTILTASTGLNHIDMEYCKAKNLKVLSLTKDYDLINNLPSTAELAFGLMSSILRNIPSGFDDVKNGGWDYDKFMGHQLKGKTIGIIGYGRLGKMMESYCRSFGMFTYIYDPYEGFNDLDSLIKNSDIISLHVHVTDKTRHMINKKMLVKMKNNSYIVNTSRGEIVNEHDIVESLKSGKLKGYATDVIEDEYGHRENSPILNGLKEGLNILVTPHVGGMTWEGQQKAYKYSIKKLEKLK